MNFFCSEKFTKIFHQIDGERQGRKDQKDTFIILRFPIRNGDIVLCFNQQFKLKFGIEKR